MMHPVRLIDWLWTIRGTLPLSPEVGADQALARLDRLCLQPGTHVVRDGAVLEFTRLRPAARDPLAMVDHGRIERRADGALAYTLVCKTLVICLLAVPCFVLLALPLPEYRSAGRNFAIVFLALYACGRVVEPRRIVRVIAYPGKLRR